MKNIVKKFYKNVSFFDPVSMGGGSGLGVKVKKLYYLCSCGKQVSPSRWAKHECGLTKRAPDLKRAARNLTVNLIPPFQAGNANR